MRRNSILLLFVSVEPEPNHPKPDLRRVTYAELYALVADLVSAFLARGLKPGDRIASYASNCIVRIFLPSVCSRRFHPLALREGLRATECGVPSCLLAPRAAAHYRRPRWRDSWLTC